MKKQFFILLIVLLVICSLNTLAQNNLKDTIFTYSYIKTKGNVFKIEKVILLSKGESLNKIYENILRVDTVGVYKKNDGYWELLDDKNNYQEKGKFKDDTPFFVFCSTGVKLTKKNGTWIYYDGNGNILKEELFDKGKLVYPMDTSMSKYGW